MAEPQKFEIGDEVDITFAKSIVMGVRRGGGNCSITVQTADTDITFDVNAADTAVTKTGVVHDLRPCPRCGNWRSLCGHPADQDEPDNGSQPSGGAS